MDTMGIPKKTIKLEWVICYITRIFEITFNLCISTVTITEKLTTVFFGTNRVVTVVINLVWRHKNTYKNYKYVFTLSIHSIKFDMKKKIIK